MSDTDKEVNLHDTTDASVWATEFCKNWTTALCQIPGKEGVETESDFQDIMLGWFANAIMAGVDSEARKTASERATLAAERDRLKARVAELEGVLHRIDDASNHYALTTTYSEGTLRYAHESTRNLARAALKNKDQGDD